MSNKEQTFGSSWNKVCKDFVDGMDEIGKTMHKRDEEEEEEIDDDTDEDDEDEDDE